MATISKDRGSGRFTPIEANQFDGKNAGGHEILESQRQRMGSTSSAVSTKQPPPPGIFRALTPTSGTYLTLYLTVACFYVRLMLESSRNFYRAIYLSGRTTHELALANSTKYGVTLIDSFKLF